MSTEITLRLAHIVTIHGFLFANILKPHPNFIISLLNQWLRHMRNGNGNRRNDPPSYHGVGPLFFNFNFQLKKKVYLYLIVHGLPSREGQPRLRVAQSAKSANRIYNYQSMGLVLLTPPRISVPFPDQG